MTDSSLDMFQDLDKTRSEHDLESLELRWLETKDLKRRLYLLLHGTTTGPTNSLVKNTTMDGSEAWLKRSREYDPMRGIDRTVAHQRVVNSEPATTEEQTRLCLPTWETNAEKYETRYQTKLDTISKMTALKIPIGPTVTGDTFIGAEFTQDKMEFQEMRKHLHNYILDSQSLNEPAQS